MKLGKGKHLNFLLYIVGILTCLLPLETASTDCGQGSWFYGFIDPNFVTFTAMDTLSYKTSSNAPISRTIALGGSTQEASSMNTF